MGRSLISGKLGLNHLLADSLDDALHLQHRRCGILAPCPLLIRLRFHLQRIETRMLMSFR